MRKLLDSKEMRIADEKAVFAGASILDLVKRAAEALAKHIPNKGGAVIVCGRGNNAADGFALASILRSMNRKVRIVSLSEELSGPAEYYLNAALSEGVPVFREMEIGEGDDIIVDCMFGTGFHGDLEGPYLDAAKKINGSSALVISADIPSGLDPDNGLTSYAVRSDLTVAFGYIKTGEKMNRAFDHIKEIVVEDVGIYSESGDTYLLDETDFGNIFKKRSRFSNKGDYGYVTLIGGSGQFPGAVGLASLGLCALRAGCGVSRVAVPESIVPYISPHVLEATLFPVSDRGGYMLFDEKNIKNALDGTKAAAVGMGWSRESETDEILSYIIRNYTEKLIIDADGLFSLSRIGCDILRERKCDIIITPHPKEFERLSGIPVPDILKNPIETAKSFAKEYDIIVLLKGPSTVITDGETAYICDRGSAGMASAGSGDVLSGVLCGLFGHSKESVLLTAAAGAFVCGMAGEYAAEDIGEISMTSRDTADRVARAVGYLYKKTNNLLV